MERVGLEGVGRDGPRRRKAASEVRGLSYQLADNDWIDRCLLGKVHGRKTPWPKLRV